MDYTVEDLNRKILEYHPEIARNGISLAVSFNQEANKYEVRLSKAGQEFGAFLEKQDADDCISGQKCVALAVLVTQVLAELEQLVSPRRPG